MKYNTIADGLVAENSGNTGYVAGCMRCRAFQEFDVYPSWHANRGKLYVVRERKCVCGGNMVMDPEAGSEEQEVARGRGKLGGVKRMEADPGMANARQARKQVRDAAIIAALAAGERVRDVAKRFHVTPSLVSQIGGASPRPCRGECGEQVTWPRQYCGECRAKRDAESFRVRNEKRGQPLSEMEAVKPRFKPGKRRSAA